MRLPHIRTASMVWLLVCAYSCVLWRSLMHHEARLLLSLLPQLDLAHFLLLVRVGDRILARAIPLAHIVKVWLLDADLWWRKALLL